ncbi:MAG: hypothetical protein M9894_37400 [Planctomycetes bacterium]|nr:hypothetical protein [Planctomycetota bacterium]
MAPDAVDPGGLAARAALLPVALVAGGALASAVAVAAAPPLSADGDDDGPALLARGLLRPVVVAAALLLLGAEVLVGGLDLHVAGAPAGGRVAIAAGLLLAVALTAGAGWALERPRGRGEGLVRLGALLRPAPTVAALAGGPSSSPTRRPGPGASGWRPPRSWRSRPRRSGRRGRRGDRPGRRRPAPAPAGGGHRRGRRGGRPGLTAAGPLGDLDGGAVAGAPRPGPRRPSGSSPRRASPARARPWRSPAPSPWGRRRRGPLDAPGALLGLAAGALAVVVPVAARVGLRVLVPALLLGAAALATPPPTPPPAARGDGAPGLVAAPAPREATR